MESIKFFKPKKIKTMINACCLLQSSNEFDTLGSFLLLGAIVPSIAVKSVKTMTPNNLKTIRVQINLTVLHL